MSAAQAAALVLAGNPGFGPVAPLRGDVVGQSAWYEVFPSRAGDFRVEVTLGSGDCQAGCIDKHTWTYTVSSTGVIEPLGDEGGDVPQPGPTPGDQPAQLSVQLTAGPSCPVEQSSPDPSCAPRPVGNAEVIVRDPAGDEAARGTTDADGRLTFSLPGGAYWVEPQPVEGLLGTPEAQAISLRGGGGLIFEYDTGIR